ncbi:helix-turn-helix transcriptional regulator [Paenibacillus apiarius]|uniref:AraC family transcriptional regulator n=1 Tax=Paenibacillus apiarius TaxID=46240 RepID=A0ABT4DWD7_9BACL|nr:helix-turn-helix domain-containing protein [Paenibacillus apiarius]MCY9517680.1 AraC family transcriptional regulator [Paenibacillus apiarius]MCY9521667.1 AraC family transcriptional regulator [Paenibacillus apiarius]MCY9555345.1 AraC family transcriptional regulator [Paenibacillus apiarius]MCY9561225.1 AraC family transcriptional regulator [Paenibacillus apiarius]MCY9686368.1 AraC family transcriptional regulator [Paenibacillus apiarius]
MARDVLITDIHDYFERFTELVNGQVHHHHGAWEQQLAIPEHIGKGSVGRVRIRPGMEIIISDITFKQDMKLRIQEACRLFELSYCVSGEIYCEWDGKESHTDKRTGNVLFLEDVQVYEEKKAGLRTQLLEIRLSPGELFRYAADAAEKHKMETWLQRHKGSIDRYPDSPAIQRCVSELMHCTYKGPMKRLYMESKAMEFIALFGEIEGLDVVGGNCFLRRDDIEQLNMARQLVLNHFEKPLSIRELSRLAGLNEFKLKKGFRELFGMTIFELVRKKRMEQALWHMEAERMNVGEAAVAVGYSNVSNFTATFRKHYGCNPSEYVKRIGQLDMKQNMAQDDSQ